MASSRAAAEESTAVTEVAHVTFARLALDTVRSDVLQFLKSGSEKWDVIILDPPAFIKSRSKIREGRQGYIDVNKKAIERLKPARL